MVNFIIKLRMVLDKISLEIRSFSKPQFICKNDLTMITEAQFQSCDLYSEYFIGRIYKSDSLFLISQDIIKYINNEDHVLVSWNLIYFIGQELI